MAEDFQKKIKQKHIKIENETYDFFVKKNKSNVHFFEINQYLTTIIKSKKKKKRKKIDLVQYKFSQFLEHFNEKSFQEFCNFFIFDSTIKKEISNKTFDYNVRPKIKTAEHIKRTSLSYNIKRINKGENERLEYIKVWSDELSHLKEKDLELLISKEEKDSICTFISSLSFSLKKIESIKRSAYRWCIRGLTSEKAIEKEKETINKSNYFIQKNLRKKYKTKRGF